jgi:DNA-binding MarR family transcriptional regulator
MLTYLVGRLHRAVRKHIAEVLRPLKLSVAQYTTLSVLRSRGSLSNAQLASRVFISPQAMNEVVQSLETLRLVTRRPDPAHGRIVQLALTPRGLRVLADCDAAVRDLERTMISGLSEAEREAFRSALTRCAEVLEGRSEA